MTTPQDPHLAQLRADYGMTTPEDTRLAQLRTRHGTHWQIWKVTTKIGAAWCVMPPGTTAAVHQEPTADQLEAWLNRVEALRAKGATLHFHEPANPSHPVTATITYTHPATRTPATTGPAPVSEAIDHAETTLAGTP